MWFMGYLCLYWYNCNYLVILIIENNFFIGYSKDINFEYVFGYLNGIGSVIVFRLCCVKLW